MEKLEMTPEVTQAFETIVELTRAARDRHEAQGGERFCRLMGEFEDLTGRRYDAVPRPVQAAFLCRLEAALSLLRDTPEQN